ALLAPTAYADVADLKKMLLAFLKTAEQDVANDWQKLKTTITTDQTVNDDPRVQEIIGALKALDQRVLKAPQKLVQLLESTTEAPWAQDRAQIVKVADAALAELDDAKTWWQLESTVFGDVGLASPLWHAVLEVMDASR